MWEERQKKEAEGRVGGYDTHNVISGQTEKNILEDKKQRAEKRGWTGQINK